MLDPALERVQKIRNQIPVLPIVVLSVSDSMPLYLKVGYRLKNRGAKHIFLTFRQFLEKGKGTSLAKPASDSEKMAVIVYTSGTTGEPKGVMLSCDNLNAVIFQYKISDMHFDRREVFLHILPPFTGYGISMLHLSICVGVENDLWIAIDAEKVAKEFERLKPNHFAAGLAHIDAITKRIKGNMNYLVNFSGGGEMILPAKEEQVDNFLKAQGADAVYTQGYGMTETAGTLCTNQNRIYRIGSMGVPFPQTNIGIVDVETGEEQTYDVVGEIIALTPSLFLGYFQNTEETTKVLEIKDGRRWIHTGDLGYVDKEGFLFITGRIKRIYLAKGKDAFPYKLFPARIEELLAAHPAVASCGVIVREDEVRLNIPIAYITLKDGVNDTKENILSELSNLAQTELPGHMQPEDIILLDTMPLTPSGKIDYQALEKELQK